MQSRKVIAGLLGIIVVISVITLIPIFIYGFTVNVVETEISIGLFSSGSLSTSSSIELQQTPSYNLNRFDVVTNEKAINAYEYIFSKLEGNIDVIEEGNGGIDVVDISITFNLTTPSNNSLSFNFNPHGLKYNRFIIIVLLGPDELNGEVGTFHLRITISITVTPPHFEVPIVNLTLTPVDLPLVIPQPPA